MGEKYYSGGGDYALDNSNSKTYKLLEATCDIRLIWKISKDILKFLYVKAFAYNKVGLILSNFSNFSNFILEVWT